MKIYKITTAILFIALFFCASDAMAAERGVFPKDPRYQAPPAGIISDGPGTNSGNLAKPGVDSSPEAVSGAPESAQSNPAVKKPFSFDVISFVMWSVIFLIIIFFAVFVFSLRRLNRKK